MDFNTQYERYRQRAEDAMNDWMPAATTVPDRLHRAMRYSLEAGGKRLRPVLLLAVYDLSPSAHNPEPAAAAVEALHTYSLIHDDLPCMDDSDLRRGQPTCHKTFDEATAVLAGDALLTEAFSLLAGAYKHRPEIAVALIEVLGKAASSTRLIGGQMEDTFGGMVDDDESRLHYIHQNKTAALITASIEMGTILSTSHKRHFAQALGHHLGMAFQIVDDILDATAQESVTGKSAGLDEKNNTLTYPRLYGLEASRKKAAEHTEKAIATAEMMAGGDAGFIVGVIKAMQARVA